MGALPFRPDDSVSGQLINHTPNGGGDGSVTMPRAIVAERNSYSPNGGGNSLLAMLQLQAMVAGEWYRSLSWLHARSAAAVKLRAFVEVNDVSKASLTFSQTQTFWRGFQIFFNLKLTLSSRLRLC